MSMEAKRTPGPSQAASLQLMQVDTRALRVRPLLAVQRLPIWCPARAWLQSLDTVVAAAAGPARTQGLAGHTPWHACLQAS